MYFWIETAKVVHLYVMGWTVNVTRIVWKQLVTERRKPGMYVLDVSFDQIHLYLKKSGSRGSSHWQIWVSSPYVAHTIPHAPAVFITVKGFGEIQVPSLVCQDHSSLVASPYPKRSGLELCRTSVTSFPFGRLIRCTDGLLQEERRWVRAGFTVSKDPEKHSPLALSWQKKVRASGGTSAPKGSDWR